MGLIVRIVVLTVGLTVSGCAGVLLSDPGEHIDQTAPIDVQPAALFGVNYYQSGKMIKLGEMNKTLRNSASSSGPAWRSEAWFWSAFAFGAVGLHLIDQSWNGSIGNQFEAAADGLGLILVGGYFVHRAELSTREAIERYNLEFSSGKTSHATWQLQPLFIQNRSAVAAPGFSLGKSF